MDFTKLLKHCEAEHGIQVDKSAFTEAILNSIFAFFAAHGEILTHTQLWDIFETLQERPKPGNPPPIVALMKGRAEENIKCGEPMESASWYSQEGVLLSTADALKIVEFCEGVHVVERLPDYGTGFRPPWDLIGPEYVACAVDRSGIIYFYNKIPKAYESKWNSGDFDDDSFYCADYPFEIKSPVENWRECLWIRPGHREKEGAE